MIALDIHLYGGGELAKHITKIIEVEHPQISFLSEGLASGRPSVSFIGEVNPTTVAVWQTSLALLATAVEAAIATHGDPRQAFTPRERAEMLAAAEAWLLELKRDLADDSDAVRAAGG